MATDTEDPNVIDRLIKEQSATANIIKEIKYYISSNNETDGMTIIGALKYLYKQLHEERDKTNRLEKELKALILKK